MSSPNSLSANGTMLGPVAEPDRIVPLDILRGFAVLGILVMNIQSFSMIESAYFNPTSYGSLEGANYWVWYFSHLLTDLKFMGIFSMLFGAGIVLMWQRAQKRSSSFFRIHYRRMFWLLIFGLLHAHLLWYGDILYPYAVCGMLLYWARKLKPATLIILALILLMICSSIYLLAGFSMSLWPEEQVREFSEETWSPPAESVAKEVAAYQGSWLEQLPLRIETALEMQTVIFLFFFFWRVGGMILLGMGLYKLGVFSATRSFRFYVSLIAFAVILAIPMISFGISRNFEAGWTPERFFLGQIYNFWGSIVVSLGWIGLVVILYRKGFLRPLTSRLTGVGRMALSCYILETLICTSIFYGHGLGLFGLVSRVQQILIVAGVWVLLLFLAPIWLRYFRYGPLEWLWRSLTYWRLLPIRRVPTWG